MTEISEAAKRKACELAPGHNFIECDAVDALARVLQEHSDVAKAVQRGLCANGQGCPPELRELILPDEPDALADLRAVLKEMYGELPPPGMDWGSALIDRVSKGLAQRGKALKIVEARDE